MAASKDTFCKFRLSTGQKERIRQMAKERGLSEGGLILHALGLEGDGAPASLPPATPPAKPDPKKEPGAAGIAELAERMANNRRKKR